VTPPQQARVFTQVLMVLAVSFGCFIHGTTVTFPAVFVPALLAANSSEKNATSGLSQAPADAGEFFPEKLPFDVSNADGALLGESICYFVTKQVRQHCPSVSISNFGMLGGSLLSGPLATTIGRKWSQLLGTWLSFAISYSLLPAVQYLWMVHLR